MALPEEILRQYWGYAGFRPLQREIIESVLDGKDTLALLPTGGGKSVCYQVPALMRDGVCLVVSPLIALMQDQVGRLRQLDIQAEYLHSGMRYADLRRVLDNTLQGAYKLLYLSPERLQTRLFQDYLPELDVSLLAVDEAHCISQWGHDFRPDYLNIATARESLPGVPVLALTASATNDVRQDICRQLLMQEPVVYAQSFSRPNIYYSVAYSENKPGDTLRALEPGASSIIYCRSRKQTETTARYLEQSVTAVRVYHAGMAQEKRGQAQEDWMADKADVMVATTAFGMGIDKEDVRKVLHYDAPEHLEAYYQEAGRAGRDGKPSKAVLWYNTTDLARLRDSTELYYPPEAYLRQVYQAVVEYLQVPIGAEPDRYFDFDVADFSKKFGLHATNAVYALKLLEKNDLWTLTESVYRPSTIQFTADRHVVDQLQQINPDLAYVAVGLLRMYNTIFFFPTPVREQAIARQLRIPREALDKALARLHQMELISYSKPGEGPQLFFHHYRVDSRYLVLDLKRIADLRQRHIARTEAMMSYLENRDQCRERMILSYFGEAPVADCGHCDICTAKAPGPKTADLKQELLAALREKGVIGIGELVKKYPAAIKEQAISLLRDWADRGKISLDRDGMVSLK